MEVYYDGINVEKWLKNPRVTGFTTNCSIMAASKYKSYKEFYDSFDFGDKPISFQIWMEDAEGAKKQIEDIHSIGPNVFVKIPIVNSKGESNSELISYASSKGYAINITAIYTKEQIIEASFLLQCHTAPAIISVFFGSISDILTVDPIDFLHTYDIYFANTKFKLLWAGCRELATVTKAREAGIDIITVPDGVIDKFDIQGKTLLELSIERALKFRTDALAGKLSIL